MIEAWLIGSFALGTAVGGFMYRGSIRSSVGMTVLNELEKGDVIDIREAEDGQMYAAAKIPEDIYLYEDIVENRLDMAQNVLEVLAEHAKEGEEISEEVLLGLIEEFTEVAHRAIRNREPSFPK